MNTYEKYFNELIYFYPSLNNIVNEKKYKFLNKEFTNTLNPLVKTRLKEFYLKYLRIINNKFKLNWYDKVFKYEVKMNLKHFNTIGNYLPINHNNNDIINFCENASGNGLYKFNTNQDYYDFIDKTNKFIDYAYNIICNMRTGITKNIVLCERLIKLLLTQLEEALKDKIYINKNVPKTVDTTLKRKNNKTFNEIISNILEDIIKDFIIFIKDEYLPSSIKFFNNNKGYKNSIGLCALKGGKKYYKMLIEKHTTLSSSNKYTNIKYIHKYGLQEVKKIMDKINCIKKLYNFENKSYKDFHNFLINNEELQLKTKEQVIKHYENMQKYIKKSVLDKYFNNDVKNVKSICNIKEVPKYKEKYYPEAYYIDNVFYINLNNKSNYSKIESESLLIHEDSPGHHMNNAYLNDSNIPLFIKVKYYTGFTEGWAMYTESLGEYNELYSYYGYLYMQLNRALRLILDTGIHYYNWSYNKCKTYYKQYYFNDDIDSHIDRYMADPGQAIAYKIGEKVFVNLRDKYLSKKYTKRRSRKHSKKHLKKSLTKKNKLSKNTDMKLIRDFHSKCLRYSNIPLKILIDEFN
tara:strand:+ start:137 stop:1864 length:1728 start_codon:yes stop_codon:yes gene_type:complete